VAAPKAVGDNRGDSAVKRAVGAVLADTVEEGRVGAMAETAAVDGGARR
jgi:hypothetical protein